MSPRRPIALAAALFGVALAPAAAHAADFHVSDAGGFNSALVQATAASSPSRIYLAPGTYFGGFSYKGSQPLEIHGPTGTDPAKIRAGKDQVGLELLGHASYVVDHLEVALDAAGVGIRIAGPGSIDAVRGRTEINGSGTLVDVEHAGLAITDSRLFGDEDTRAVFDDAPGVLDIEGTTFSAPTTAVWAKGAGVQVAMHRDRILTTYGRGVHVDAGAKVAVSDSLIDLGHRDGIALDAGDAGAPSNATAAIDADRLTIVGDGQADQTAAAVTPSSVGGDFTIHLANSIVDAVTTPLVCTPGKNGFAAVLTNYSRVPAGSQDACGGAFTQSHPVVAADPGLGSDLRLTATSPLVDAGDPAVTATPADLDGKPRPAVGHAGQAARLDLGAYERQTTAPVLGPPPVSPPPVVPPVTPPAPTSPTPPVAAPAAAAPASPATPATPPTAASTPAPRPAPAAATAPARDALAPVLSGARLTRSALRFRLSEPATVAISVTCRGRSSARARTTVTGRPGDNARSRRTAPFAGLRPGTYSVGLVARDRAGHASAAVTLRLVVRRAHR